DVAQDVTRRGAGAGKVRVDGGGRYHGARGDDSGSTISGHATPASPNMPAPREVLGCPSGGSAWRRQKGTSCLRRSRRAWRAASTSCCVTWPSLLASSLLKRWQAPVTSSSVRTPLPSLSSSWNVGR